jgi:hypothetical protein
MDSFLRASLMLLAGVLLLGSCTSKIKERGGVGGTRNALGPPSNLTGVLVGSSIDLAWVRNSSAELGFRVDIATQPITQLSDVSSAVVVPAGTTSYTYPVPSIGPTYYFRVLAVTSTLESDPSNVVGIQTVVSPPATPPGVTAVGISTSTIQVTWIDVGGAATYFLERTADHGTTWSPLITLGPSASSWPDNGLPANTDYCYRVTASNTAGSSAPSAMACGQTLCANQSSSVVYNTTDAGLYTSMVLNGSTEYISHYDNTRSIVLVTVGGGGGTTVADSGPSAGSVVGSDGTSIAISGTTLVTTEHHTVTGSTVVNKLRYAQTGPGDLSFASAVRDPAQVGGGHPRVSVNNASGVFMYIYTTIFSGVMTLSYYNGSYNAVDTSSNTSFSGTAMDVDVNSTFHCAYTRQPVGSTGNALTYGYKPTGSVGWGLTSLGSGNPTDVGIVVDNVSNGIAFQGVPHIVYYDSAGKRLMHVWGGGPWQTEVVDNTTSADVGAYCSVALSGGRLHVAYYDRVNGDLRYARKDGTGPWMLFLIDAVGNVGTYTSIAAEGGGTVHIAYRDETNHALKLAVGTP